MRNPARPTLPTVRIVAENGADRADAQPLGSLGGNWRWRMLPGQLSDDIEGLPEESCCVRELAARFHGGPIPAKFALTEVGGRIVCLDFEECAPETAPAVTRAAVQGPSSN